MRTTVDYERLRGLVKRLRATFSVPVILGDGIVTPKRRTIAAIEYRYVNPNGPEAATEIEALLDRIAKLEEARDHYAGMYAERYGMLLQAQAERDAAEKRVSEAVEIITESVALNENYYAVEDPDGYRFTEAPVVIGMARAFLTKEPTP